MRVPPTKAVRSLLPRGEKAGMGVKPRPQPTVRNGTKWNEMEQNGTELKVLPLLATRNEANQGRLARRRSPLPLGVGQGEGCAKRGQGGPISSLAARSKQGQTGPGFTPSSSLPRRRSDPLALWERVRVRVPQPVALLASAPQRSFSAKNAIVFSHESAAASA